MKLIDPMIMEYEHECGVTRKCLERVPFEHADWTPHPKSFTMGALASHIAESQMWVKPTCEMDEFEFDPAKFVPYKAASLNDLLKTFDENVKVAVATMKTVSDEAYLKNWRMTMPDGTVLFEMPRGGVLRTMILSHTVHHRAQLAVYLRLKDVPVPSIYGPSADEQG